MINARLETVANIKILFKVQPVRAKDSRMQSAGLFSKGPARVYLLYCEGVLWKRSCGIDLSKLRCIPYNFILNPKFSAKLSQFSLLSCSFVSYPRAICSFSILSFNLSLEARPNELGTLSIDNSFVLDMLWRSDIS